MGHLVTSPASVSPTLMSGASLHQRIREVADIAASEASAVDSDGTFPTAAIAAAKRLKLLSLTVPTRLGGQGGSTADAADASFIIARACSSTGMIIAMHFAALACLANHSIDSAWHESLLRRVAAEELLIASSTTEGNQGGNVRSSASALVDAGEHVSLERAATVVSYGLEADCIVTTARRDPDAASSDQVLAVFTRGDCSLKPLREWKTLGMRGTRSGGFELRASSPREQVLTVPYKTIHAQTMVPLSHILWCSVWVGIAAASVSRAQHFLRFTARQNGGALPPNTILFTKAVGQLETIRSRVNASIGDYEAARNDPASLEAIEKQTHYNLMKVEVSEGALAVVSLAMRVCGLAGYREDGEYSVARHLRDVQSAPIMINNERILGNVASASILTPLAGALGTS